MYIYLSLFNLKNKKKLCESASYAYENENEREVMFIRSFKGRFRTMKDGQIRRWKEGKRHNAHLKACF